jgi:hypothetical protein
MGSTAVNGSLSSTVIKAGWLAGHLVLLNTNASFAVGKLFTPHPRILDETELKRTCVLKWEAIHCLLEPQNLDAPLVRR